MSNTTEKRTELSFGFQRNHYCCGIVEIGDFEVHVKNRWDRNAKEPPLFTFDESLALFRKKVKDWLHEEYRRDDYGDDPPVYGEKALLRATVTHSNVIQKYAEEILKADGWDLIATFNNVNSENTVFCYQKEVPTGEFIEGE